MDANEKYELELKYCKRRVHVVINDEYHPIDTEGVVESVDDAGQLHGTWGSLAAIPGTDTIELLPSAVTSVIKTELSVDRTMFVITDDGYIYKISEGTGDNLEEKDIVDGYVDYIYYDVFCSLEDLNEDIIDDGGMILLKKLYKEHSVEEILKVVEDFANVKFVVEKDK